jgi:hypothetical protein
MPGPTPAYTGVLGESSENSHKNNCTYDYSTIYDITTHNNDVLPRNTCTSILAENKTPEYLQAQRETM